MSGVSSVVQDHVGLPGLGGDALLDAPPEILLALATPGEHGNVVFGQGGSDLVLGRVDVASGPTNLNLTEKKCVTEFIFQSNIKTAKFSENLLNNSKPN